MLAKAPLLRIASDSLSFTLAAVLPPPTIDRSTDIWSHTLARDKHFAENVKKMCQRYKCQVTVRILDRIYCCDTLCKVNNANFVQLN